MPKKNNKWTYNEDHLITELYLKARPSARLTIPDLTYTLNQSMRKDRTQDAVRNRAHILRRELMRQGGLERQDQWFSGMRIGYFDIETYGFKANFGVMLSWAMWIPDTFTIQHDGKIKLSDNGVILSDKMSRKDAVNYKSTDKAITKSLMKAIDEVDMVVGYYSTRFDVPFVRTRAKKHGIKFPLYQQKYHYDVWFTVRSLYSLSRNTLEQACALVGIDGKTHVDYDIWDGARLGDPECMQYVWEHNVADVEILGRLHEEISGQRPLQRRSL